MKRLSSASLASLSLVALVGCGQVIDLGDGYYVADGGGGSSGTGSGNFGGTSGTAAGNGPLKVPAGKLVFERYSSYGVGDSKMYVVTFPAGTISAELSKTYDICSPFNGIFSPDGRYLVVGAVPASVCPAGFLDRNELEVYILDLENPTAQGKQRVTDNGVPDEDPQYAPDGKSILFKHGGYLARWVVGSTPFNETCNDPGASFCFAHSGGTLQSKPVMDDTGSVCYESSLNQHDPGGDILCFDLAVGLAGKDITQLDNVTLAVATDKIYDSRPVIALPYLYYTRWRSAAAQVNQIWRRPLKDLLMPASKAAFCSNDNVNYEDVFSLGEGDLVVFSLNANSGWKNDLFIGDFKRTASVPLSNFAPGVNGPQEELGAAFWPAPR